MTIPRPSVPNNAASVAAGERPRFGLGEGANRRGGRWGALGSIAGALVATLLVGGLVWSAATGQAPPAQKPQIFGGSLVLDDYRPLAVVDLAVGSVTVRLEGVYAQVGAGSYSGVQAVSTSAGTMLVNRATGTFNMLGKDDFVLGPAQGGISLGPLPGSTGASGFAAGASTYIVRYARHSTVSLVGASTVEAGAEAVAIHSRRAVRPLGFARLGLVDRRPGGAAVAGSSLWALVGSGKNCTLARLSPSSRATLGLVATTVSTLSVPCSRAALEGLGGRVALAMPGRLEIFGESGRPLVVPMPGTRHALAFLPVTGGQNDPVYLERLGSGWSVLGMIGREPSGAFTLAHFGPRSRPVVPAWSRGLIYTLDQAQPGQPTLWTIDPVTGAMKPVPGTSAYPAESVTEKASFYGAEVLVDGPRVVFNNPESLLAVVVFTDGSHAPVVLDKSAAIVVSAAGPGDVNVKTPRKKHSGNAHNAHHNSRGHHHAGSPNSHTVATTVPPTTVPPPVPQPPVQPAAQPASQQVDCATTTEKPYQPQVTSVVPSDASALVKWSYHLLDEQDCLPSSWSVTVTALRGAKPPAQPVQFVNGQQQLLVTGLTPGTSYQGVVTAYIGKQSTASASFTFSTTAVGPGPPAAVSEAADGKGGWVVSWSGCAGGAACLVPATKWVITGETCGGGYVARPPQLTAPGDASSISINDGDGLGLLGDSLRFVVQGVSAQGLLGAPVAAGRCSQAWEAPNTADLSFLAAGVPSGQTVTAQLSVVVLHGLAPAFALGGDQVSFTFRVAGQVVGPTSSPSVSVPGLAPSRLYQATVTITPAGHPQAAVTMSSAQFTKNLPWPANLRLQVSGSAGPDANAGTAVATFAGLPSGSFLAQGRITCGSVSLPVSGSVLGSQFLAGVDLDEMGGRCTMALDLTSTLSPNPYGVPSPLLTAPFTIGSQQTYGFSAQASQPCTTACQTLNLYVTFNGTGQPAGTDWKVAAAAPPAGCSAATTPSAVAAFPVTLKWPLSCPTPEVIVSWVYLGQPSSAPASLPSFPAPSTTAAPTTLPPAATTTLAPTTTTATTEPTTVRRTTTTTVAPAATTTTALPVTSTTSPSTSVATTETTAPTSTTTTTSPTTTTAPTSTTTTQPATTTTTSSTTTTTVPTTTSTAPTSTTASSSTSTTRPGTTTTTTSGTTGLVFAAQLRPPFGGGPDATLWGLLAGMLIATLACAGTWVLRRPATSRPSFKTARNKKAPPMTALEATI